MKVLRFEFLLCLVLLALCSCGSSNSANSTAGEAQVPADLIDPQDLSVSALKIKQGMTRERVFQLLGKPTWVALPGDAGDYGRLDENTAMVFYWRNPGLAVVEAQFGKDGKVRFDGGKPVNSSSYSHMFEPSEQYGCDQADRKKYCQ